MSRSELIYVKRLSADDESSIESFFQDILWATLKYKFRHSMSPLLVNGKIMTDSVFELTDHENLHLYGKKYNGQRIRELFIVSIYLKKFLHGGYKYLVISLPEKEESWDVCISLTNEREKMIDGKPHLGDDQVGITIQVKEHFDNKGERSSFDLDFISRKVKYHKDEFFLFFNRDFLVSGPEEQRKLEEFLSLHENICLLSITGSVLDEKGKERLSQNNKIHFLLRSGRQKIPLEFNIPSFLHSISPPPRHTLPL